MVAKHEFFSLFGIYFSLELAVYASRMFADSSIGPQTFNLWVWRSAKGVGIH